MAAGMDALQLGLEALRPDVDSLEPGVESQQQDAEAPRLGSEALQPDVGSREPGMETQQLDSDLYGPGMHSQPPDADSRQMGVGCMPPDANAQQQGSIPQQQLELESQQADTCGDEGVWQPDGADAQQSLVDRRQLDNPRQPSSAVGSLASDTAWQQPHADSRGPEIDSQLPHAASWQTASAAAAVGSLQRALREVRLALERRRLAASAAEATLLALQEQREAMARGMEKADVEHRAELAPQMEVMHRASICQSAQLACHQRMRAISLVFVVRLPVHPSTHLPIATSSHSPCRLPNAVLSKPVPNN
jgi:hypothetical protein